jgi:hypothetical protein
MISKKKKKHLDTTQHTLIKHAELFVFSTAITTMGIILKYNKGNLTDELLTEMMTIFSSLFLHDIRMGDVRDIAMNRAAGAGMIRQLLLSKYPRLWMLAQINLGK